MPVELDVLMSKVFSRPGPIGVNKVEIVEELFWNGRTRIWAVWEYRTGTIMVGSGQGSQKAPKNWIIG